jgi:hypothetical protein
VATADRGAGAARGGQGGGDAHVGRGAGAAKCLKMEDYVEILNS